MLSWNPDGFNARSPFSSYITPRGLALTSLSNVFPVPGSFFLEIFQLVLRPKLNHELSF